MEDEIKKYNCLTEEEQSYYAGLNRNKRLYVDFRAQGYNRANAYVMAGFTGDNASQSAYNMEKRDQGLVDLITILRKDMTLRTIGKQDSKLNQRIDALAKQVKTEQVLATIDGADGETAERIKFFRDIVNGKIKSKKIIREYNAEKKVVKTREEVYEDVGVKLQARKELDRILGLNQIVDVGKIEMGELTINIVDASNKNALADDRNKIKELRNDDEDIVVDGEILDDNGR